MLWYPWLKFYFPSLGDMAVYYNNFNGMADSCVGSLDLYLIFGCNKRPGRVNRINMVVIFWSVNCARDPSVRPSCNLLGIKLLNYEI